MTRAERVSAVAGSALALGAFELLLARTSGGPQVRDDLVAAALGWAALGAGAAALAAIGRRSATLPPPGSRPSSCSGSRCRRCASRGAA
jgi:hypothetical protein